MTQDKFVQVRRKKESYRGTPTDDSADCTDLNKSNAQVIFGRFLSSPMVFHIITYYQWRYVMDKRATAIVSYFSLIGWIIAYCIGDREGAKFHLNQSLVILLTGIIAGACAVIPIIGHLVSSVLGIITFIFWVMGLVFACENKDQEVPILGIFKILK